MTLLLSLGSLTDLATAESNFIPLDAVGRILDEDYEFKCTGFIIGSVSHRIEVNSSHTYGNARIWYENTLITAGHCREHTHFFRAKNGQTYTIENIVGYSDHKFGYDILVAKFSSPTAIPTLDPAYHHALSPGELVMLIGYGRTVMQIKVNTFLGYNTRGDLIVDGISGPGDSGSPVLLPGTRMVIGILHTGTVDVPLAGRSNPYFCMFQECPSTRPYYATPIDRIQGLVR